MVSSQTLSPPPPSVGNRNNTRLGIFFHSIYGMPTQLAHRITSHACMGPTCRAGDYFNFDVNSWIFRARGNGVREPTSDGRNP